MSSRRIIVLWLVIANQKVIIIPEMNRLGLLWYATHNIKPVWLHKGSKQRGGSLMHLLCAKPMSFGGAIGLMAITLCKSSHTLARVHSHQRIGLNRLGYIAGPAERGQLRLE